MFHQLRSGMLAARHLSLAFISIDLRSSAVIHQTL